MNNKAIPQRESVHNGFHMRGSEIFWVLGRATNTPEANGTPRRALDLRGKNPLTVYLTTWEGMSFSDHRYPEGIVILKLGSDTGMRAKEAESPQLYYCTLEEYFATDNGVPRFTFVGVARPPGIATSA